MPTEMDGRRFSLCLSLSFALFLHRQSVFPRRAFLLNMHRTNNQNVKSLASFHSTFQYIYKYICVDKNTFFALFSKSTIGCCVSFELSISVPFCGRHITFIALLFGFQRNLYFVSHCNCDDIITL